MIGLTYGKGDFYWQNITFYDSKCRECNDGVVEEEPVWYEFFSNMEHKFIYINKWIELKLNFFMT